MHTNLFVTFAYNANMISFIYFFFILFIFNGKDNFNDLRCKVIFTVCKKLNLK